jgi:hypothetical protein
MEKASSFSSVWDALLHQDAARFKVRSALMIELNESIKQWSGSDTVKFARLGITLWEPACWRSSAKRSQQSTNFID